MFDLQIKGNISLHLEHPFHSPPRTHLEQQLDIDEGLLGLATDNTLQGLANQKRVCFCTLD